MKKLTQILCAAAIALPATVMAQASNDSSVQAFAAGLDLDIATCRAANLTYKMQRSMSADSPDTAKARNEYTDCIHTNSSKAKADFPLALKSTKSKDVKEALKGLYVAWSAYFGEFEGASAGLAKSNYETAKSKLDVELLSQ
ncbi:hypothetical protein [Pseudomonas sp. GL-R-26]|uniref:hypothetical protein n=1 Tax=Pseudomonas sp. GL-R-26 TaxID=2832392 RepID=UPI001CBB3119|nr:hypothetical protein [Pseudomonas sp. GL-R-26]